MGNTSPQQIEHTYDNGNHYAGSMVAGKRHGKGKYTWADDGCYYDGEWVYNKQQGIGTMTYKNGNSFTGMFQKNNLNGDGVMSTKNGEQIDGNWGFVRRLATHDGPQFPVSLYKLDVKLLDKSGGSTEYKGPATLHLFTGMLFLHGINAGPTEEQTKTMYDSAVVVLQPVSEKDTKDDGNLAVVEAVPIVMAEPTGGNDTGINYGYDEAFSKQIKRDQKPVNPFYHMF